VEGIEHHLSPSTVTAIEHLVRFLQSRDDWREAFQRYREEQAAACSQD